MAYCSDCGTELAEDVQFCSNCGTEVAADSNEGASEPTVSPDSSDGINWSLLVTAGVLGLIIGGFAAWATANLGIAAIAFVVGAGGGTYYLYQKRIPSEAAGSGLYITALLMILTPLLFYIPEVMSTSEAQGAEEAGAFVGSLVGLVIWGFAFALFALVTAAIGYFLKKRAAKKLGEA